MSTYDDPEIIARRLLQTTKQQSSASATVMLDQAQAQAQISVDAHAAQRSGIHGVPPGMYVARTSNPSGFVRWSEIVGIPPGGLDPATLELGADQLVRGTIPDARLPIADAGETSERLVRSNDPRLSGAALVRISSEPLAAGDWVSIHAVDGEQRVRKATANQPDGAIGFVAVSCGGGETAQIFTSGENQWGAIAGATPEHLNQTVFLSTTPGHASLTPPQASGQIIQPIGVLVGFNGLLAAVMVRFEFRFHL